MPDQPSPVAHWPLATDCRDVIGELHGDGRYLTWVAGPAGLGGAARFDGRGSRVQVADDPRLRVGGGDFSLAVWLRCRRPMTASFGDIINKYDPALRCGLNLHISGSSPAYSSMADQRHVHVGIDDAYCGEWRDLGKPEPTNSLVTATVTWQGRLYAGIADALDPTRACRVFRYEDEGGWTDCGRLGEDPWVRSVMSMTVHDGAIYAGSGNWDWIRAQHAEAGFAPGYVHVYRYEGGTTWTDLGQVGTGRRVMCLGSYDGHLYAGLDADDGGGRVYRLDGEHWVDCGAPDGRNVEGMLPMGGEFYVATHGNVYRYVGADQWEQIADCPYEINQIHSMAEVGGQLWIGTWPQGYVLRREADGSWTNTGRLGISEGFYDCNEVMDLRVYNGKLYAGLIPKSQVWRYESDGHWTMVQSLGSRPDWSADEDALATWCRITSLGSYRGELIAATGTCVSRAEHQDPDDTLGRVWAWRAGVVASHEHDIGDAWTHVAACRRGRQVELYINGALSAVSELPARTSMDISTATPLLIGHGPQAPFAGDLADLRLYDQALPAAAVAALAGKR